MPAQARVPYRVHAALDAMEPTCPHSLVHRLPAEAEVNQLAARDQPVVVRGKRGDSLIDGALGEFAYHW